MVVPPICGSIAAASHGVLCRAMLMAESPGRSVVSRSSKPSSKIEAGRNA